ncbi:MAG: hypothetical protein NUW06_05500 [Candidatus Acetothermia bacterium]|nr:hypothetical protein [Candidatus Acetothermia bacterium]MDH7506024.1 hypothetical protein [Candidatus Acetothermia bacterium]
MEKAGWLPKTVRETTVPKTEAITRGTNERVLNSRRISSTAKRTPAIGVLKVAATAAAAPQPTRTLRSWEPSRRSWPRAEPAAEPIWTIGPSLPEEPPLPMQIPEARALARTTLGRIRPPRAAIAAITSGTP